MQAFSIPQDASLEVSAPGGEALGDIRTAEDEDVSRANIDAVFEFACRFIVVNSLPGWIDDICTEHLQSVQPIFVLTKESGPVQAATGAHNSNVSVWRKTQATLDVRHQASDQKIDV
jgi:hypothetical protein